MVVQDTQCGRDLTALQGSFGVVVVNNMCHESLAPLRLLLVSLAVLVVARQRSSSQAIYRATGATSGPFLRAFVRALYDLRRAKPGETTENYSHFGAA